MTTSNPASHVADERQILHLISSWEQAIMARDPDGIVAGYASDILLFDAIPPYKTIGKEAVREAWAQCLPYFPETFRAEHRDLSIHVAGDVAFAHFLFHFAPTPADDPCGQTWMRITEGYRRTEGGWQVVHSHVSVPFNPMNNQAWVIADPAVVNVPDYGQAPA